MPCRVGRQACSFASKDWGIAVWPTVRGSQEGLKRRADDAARRRKKVVTVPMEKSIPERDAGLSRPARKTRASQRSREELNTQSQAVSEPQLAEESIVGGVQGQVETGSVPPAALGDSWCQPTGRVEQLFLEDLVPFERSYKSESKTLTSLWAAEEELSAVRAREGVLVDLLQQMVERRRGLIDAMLERLHAEISRLQDGAEVEVDDDEEVGGEREKRGEVKR
jgi:hypothetical protein